MKLDAFWYQPLAVHCWWAKSHSYSQTLEKGGWIFRPCLYDVFEKQCVYTQTLQKWRKWQIKQHYHFCSRFVRKMQEKFPQAWHPSYTLRQKLVTVKHQSQRNPMFSEVNVAVFGFCQQSLVALMRKALWLCKNIKNCAIASKTMKALLILPINNT